MDLKKPAMTEPHSYSGRFAAEVEIGLGAARQTHVG